MNWVRGAKRRNNQERGENRMKFTRITVDPRQMGGVPCLRGLRIPVAAVVAMVADGMSETEILAAYPDLRREDLAEALLCAMPPRRFASASCRSSAFEPRLRFLRVVADCRRA